MSVSFRTKLFSIVGAAVVSLLAVILGSALIGLEQNRALVDVQNRLLPRLEYGPRMRADFERLARSMQDAVAAQDSSALEASAEIKDTLLGHLARVRPAIDPKGAAALGRAIQDYYRMALEVSRRLIQAETGEGIVDDIARMQARQKKVDELIGRTVELERSELTEGFADVRGANQRADRFRLAIGLVV